MSLLVRDLKYPPPEIRKAEQAATDRVERFRRARLKTLSEDQKQRFERWLKKTVKAAVKEFQPLQRKLVRWYNLLEGVVEDTNFPFEGASNVTLKVALAYARVFRSAFNSTVYKVDEDLFFPDLPDEAEKELQLNAAALQHLEEALGHAFAHDSNGLQALKSGTVPAFRDGTFLLEGSVERRLESVHDERSYAKLEDFQKDYPDAQSAGISTETYQDLVDHFLVEGEEAELLVRFTHEIVAFEGLEFRAIPRAKFLVYPTTVKRMRDAVLYGGGTEVSPNELQRRARAGELYKEAVARALAKRGKGADLSEWERAQAFGQGRAVPDPEQAPVRVLDLVVKYDLDGDGTDELWRVSVSKEMEEVTLLSVRPYDVPRNVRNVVPFRLIDKGGFDGGSLVGDCEDLYKQLDDLARHDFNVMVLTTSPIFLIKNTLKDDVDLGRAENVIRPGVAYYLDDISDKSMRQLPIQDVAAMTGGNQPRIAFLTKVIELITGVSAGESGAQTPDDPRAPARKTQLLLLQANRRVDDCIDEWSLSIPDLFDLLVALLRQLGLPLDGVPPQILADPRLKGLAKRRSVTLTPEYGLARLQSLLASYLQVRPLLLQGDPVVREAWERQVRYSGEPQADKFLLNPAQAEQLAQVAMKMTMMNQKMASDLNARKKGEETLAKESAKMVVGHIDEKMRLALTGQTPDPMGAPPPPNGAPPVPVGAPR